MEDERTPTRYGSLADYGLAIVLTAVTMAVKLQWPELLGAHTPFLLLFSAVLGSAWRGGLGPGLVSTVSIGIWAWFAFLRPEPGAPLTQSLLQVAVFMAEGALISYACDRRNRAHRQMLSWTARLEERVDERTSELQAVNVTLRREIDTRREIELRLREEVRTRREAERLLVENAAQLSKSNRELENFASIASHDLQEPLRKIQAFGDRLATRHRAVLDEEGSLYLERMLDAASRMRGLIDDLLRYSRVMTRGKEYVPVNLDDVVAQVRDDLEMRIEGTGATIDVDPLPTVDGDPTQLHQLFQNLLSNSIKFCRKGQPPQVRITCEEVFSADPDDAPPSDGARWHRIVVEDRGIGFQAEYSEKIFGLFQRLHSRAEYEGTGIGLAVCRRIVERHGGSITAEGIPGEGARFIMLLPAHQPHYEHYAHAQGTAVDSDG